MAEDIYGTGSESAEEPPKSKNETISTKTQDFFDKYKEELDKKMKKCDSDLSVKNTEKETACSNYEFALTYLNQAKDAVSEYEKISNCTTTIMNQDVTEIDNKISNTIALSGQVKTDLDAAIEAVRDAKSKIAVVDSLACKLTDALGQSCNSEEMKVLKKIQGFEETVRKLIQKANQANNAVDDAHEVAIKVSATQAFTNVESLKDFGTNLKTKGAAFHANVLENLTFNHTKYEEATTGLNDSLVGTSTAEFAMNAQSLCCTGLSELNNDTFDKDMDTISEELIKICDEMEAVVGVEVNISTD